MRYRHGRVLMIAFALGLPHAAAAGEDAEPGPFSLEFGAGVEYDSNVAVLELDTSSGEGDLAALIEFHLGFDKSLTKRLKVDLGYDFSQSLHDEFDQFDIAIHRGSAGMEYDFGGVDAGASFQYADAALDGDEYLVLRQVSPHLSRLFGKRLFGRLAWTHTDKKFATSPGRDATSDGPGVDVFVFLDGVKRYLTLGYQIQDEHALDDQFDNTGSRLKLQFAARTARGSRETSWKTGLRYESRNYRDGLLPLGPPREDDRYRFDAEVEVSLARHGFFRFRYEYADNRSNLASVDFDEHVASIAFGAKL